MNIIEKIKLIFYKVEDLLYENHSCIGCGIEIPDGTKYSLCKDCSFEIKVIEENVENKKTNYFIKNSSYCYYDKLASTIIKNFKYFNKKYYAKYIAEMMTEKLEIFKNIDYITFVPASLSSDKKRGFNQSKELANEISKIINIPVVEILGKKDGFKNQASLTQKLRLSNLKGAFFVKIENKDFLKSKNILIVDDVLTTGTTLKRCREEIKTLQPKNIYSLTFAKTRFQKK